ncbi:MAG: YitT family protein [Candidatus Wallbacteria bacterium]|nr:YitT family protein [Candidatus Wallbacteria bacterium]
MHKFLHQLLKICLLCVGVFAAAFGLKGFLLPNCFIDGGVTGISMLISAVSGWSLPLLIVLVNIPFIVIGYYHVGRTFCISASFAILGLGLTLLLVHFPVVTTDKLLDAVFGGIMLGAGVGLSIRGGGVLDGTEIVALVSSKKLGATVGDVILLMNIIIFSFAAQLLSPEIAMYSILTYFSAAKTVDFILYGIEEYQGVTIISAKNAEIKQMIVNDLGRGVTVFQGRGGFTEAEQDILLCVITRLEVSKLRSMIHEIDESAFVITEHISEASGGMVKKRGFHG